MCNHGSIQFPTWYWWQNSFLERFLVGITDISLRKSLTSIQPGLYMWTRSCQGCQIDKERLLISGISCPSPMKLCSCRLAWNSCLNKRGDRPPLWCWAPIGRAGRLLYSLSCTAVATTQYQNWEGALWFRWKGRQFQCKEWSVLDGGYLFSQKPWDLRLHLCFTKTSQLNVTIFL